MKDLDKMDKIVEVGFEIILGVWLLNVFIEGLFDVNVIKLVLNKIKKWAGECDDPA